MSRIHSVDVIRLAAIAGVIAIHTSAFSIDPPGGNDAYKYLEVFVNQAARFAVPFFFVISGYFWGVKVRGGASPLLSAQKTAKRIALLFFVWCLVYLLPYNPAAFCGHGLWGSVKVAHCNICGQIEEPARLVLEGTRVHLWFLVALLCSLGISACLVHMRRVKTLVVVSGLLYVVGVLARAYSDTPIGLKIGIDTRNGPFFGTLLFVSGYLMSKYQADSRWFARGLLVFCFGTALHFSEVFVLWRGYGIYPEHEYVLGTCFMGVGIAMVSLSDHSLLRSKSLGRIGELTLGIYAVHLIFVDLLRPIDDRLDSPVWEVGYVVLVLILSIVAVEVLSRNRYTRRIVA